MRTGRVFHWLTLLLVAGAASVGLLYGTAWLMRPNMSTAVALPSPDAIRQGEQARRTDLDPAHPLVLYRPVDYAQGPAAPWYPKGQAPILDDLVSRGALPPVAQRTGPEPVVVEGVEGNGRYGGTWYMACTFESDIFSVAGVRMSSATLLRWSPQGYPLVPHVAKSYEVSPDCREFTFTLRKGMKWSDGEPFTADDIMYWWECEVKDPEITAVMPAIMKIGGQSGTVEKIDDLHVKFVFPKPNGLFLAKLATPSGIAIVSQPAHYLRKYHPKLGDDRAIAEMMQARRLASRLAVYTAVKDRNNPECPRLWPWVYRTHRANPPYAFVRNPYYWMVDTAGNQLPYVDRLLFEVKNAELINAAAANGQLTMQSRFITYDHYTLLMSERKASDYDVFHWYLADRSNFVISPNLNRKIDPDRPETAKKHALLNDKRFRQALSLAINRREIIDAEYNGQTVASQIAPGPASYFNEPALDRSFIEFDPARANRLLDEAGLAVRDSEGMRTFPDGSRMTLYLDICPSIQVGPAQFVVDDWNRVGLRVILRLKARNLWNIEYAAMLQDLTVWTGDTEHLPLLAPRYFLPVEDGCMYAPGFCKWYLRGGLYGDPAANGPGCVEPPPGHPLRQAMEIFEQVMATGDIKVQRELFRKILLIAAENVWTINICTPPPEVGVVKKGFHNVPKTAVSSWNLATPANAGVETYFFEVPADSPGAVRQIAAAIEKVTPLPDVPVADGAVGGEAASRPDGSNAAAGALLTGSIIRWLFLGIAGLLVILVAVRHPYIGRRLLIMVPTLLIISVIVFVIIQLPPGDYLTTRIMQLQEAGDQADLSQINDIKIQFHMDDPMPLRYARWLGLIWFGARQDSDAGLLQGHLGRSMETSRPVNEIVGDRILLTVLISLGTILMTWTIALPIGIFSAVRQYSPADYALTFLGFVGMCFPSFLLALVLIFLAKRYLGIEVSGLFSSQYGGQPEWDWGKLLDLLKHIWVPIVVLGVGGTAGMIRVMRGNLLDELKKPYVVAARARGVRPLKLLLKYPVRIALNPFVSGIGGLFPQLVSGGAIVAMVLALPTVGPLMLQALMTADTYLAGSMLMVLSLLGVFGTLVSDLLLLWLDPRIRFKGASR